MRRILPVFAMLAVAAMLASASGAARTSPSISFFSAGGGTRADWARTSDRPDHMAMIYQPSTTGYAGAYIHHVEGLPIADFNESSFDFKSSVASPSSLGYPRLHFFFTDGGNAYLRPLEWTTSYQTVSGNNWDSNGGTCGFQYQTSWSNVKSCHAGSAISFIIFITDPGIDVRFTVDELNVGGLETFSRPSDNSNA